MERCFEQVKWGAYGLIIDTLHRLAVIYISNTERLRKTLLYISAYFFNKYSHYWELFCEFHCSLYKVGCAYSSCFKRSVVHWNTTCGTVSMAYLKAVSNFFGAFAKLWKATVNFVMSVCLFAWNNLSPTGRIFMKFLFVNFFLTLSKILKFH